MKKLRVDMNELEGAYTMDQMSEMDSYLDTETGRVITITSEERAAVEEFFESGAAEDENADVNAEFDRWLKEYDCPDWQADAIADAYRIERDCDKRYLWIEKQQSYEGYDEMVDFAESVTDTTLRRLLGVALNGKGAFRRFKDVLLDYPEERDRWFEFSNQRIRQRLLKWLRDADIEVEDARPNGSS